MILKLDNIYRQSEAARLLNINRATFQSIVNRMVQKDNPVYINGLIEFSLVQSEDGLTLVYLEPDVINAINSDVV